MIYTEPNAGVAPVIEFIQEAHSQLMLNLYYVNDQDVLRAIGADVQRGVNVFVIVAGNPYRISSEQVQAEFTNLQQAGAKVIIAPPQFESQEGHTSFDHAKYGVSDGGASNGEVLIGTANWDVSAFSRNREYIYSSADPNLVKCLSGVFVADFSGITAPDVKAACPDLVVSPGSADDIVEAISQPGPVEIEVEELGSDPQILNAIASKGADAKLILPPDGGKPEILQQLQQAGVSIKLLSSPYIHGKMVLGGSYAFVGSQNFSHTSLTYNREIGILIGATGDMQTMQATFAADWNR